ncbi:MAG: hemin-degrading factor [Casimicrobiaceae bacterium]|nr:hemin-degrading factor [Casimicrobiaceae bacterium]MCX8098712.1 hemin-degrading factor [Casimicrobiaceae bacterium]MDW8312151.1 ChuX/HutX family heme-like substrate-binding protein [Burkholderiales bacterium]
MSTITVEPNPTSAPEVPQPRAGRDIASLRRDYARIKAERKLRQREAAAAIGLSEGEAVALHVGAEAPLRATRLRAADAPRLIEGLKACGPLMALTRNEAAVHERIGVYEEASEKAHVGLVLGPDIDLRIFYKHWKEAFLVREAQADGERLSLQFYDADGTAVHKVFERPATDRAALLELAELYTAEDQRPTWVAELPEYEPAQEDSEPDSADLKEFLRAWSNLQDTHEFFGLLKRFGLSRTRAMAVAQGQFTTPVAPGSAGRLLEEAARRGLEIMVFVGNPGCIQIHTGAVANIQRLGPWVNVMDPLFNLHLREDLINQAWIVRKPTADGVVTSLELFDLAGETIALFFGKRKPGVPEREDWRTLAADIEREGRLSA